MWPLLTAAAGPLVSGIASAFGQHSANKQNVRLSREGMAFEGEQARQQMAFQERMSNSSYQRASEDMQLAGINPMLAYAQGGASTPGGGAASGAAATVQDVIGPAVASAQHARQLAADLKQRKAETELAVQRQWTEEQNRHESRTRVDVNQATADQTRQNTAIQGLSIPAARNQARIDSGRFGSTAAWADRIFGGRGLLSPIGLRR